MLSKIKQLPIVKSGAKVIIIPEKKFTTSFFVYFFTCNGYLFTYAIITDLLHENYSCYYFLVLHLIIFTTTQRAQRETT